MPSVMRLQRDPGWPNDGATAAEEHVSGHSHTYAFSQGMGLPAPELNSTLAQQVAETSNFVPSPHSMQRRHPAGTSRNEKVFNCLYPKPNAVFKLICFPWAGSGSTYFAKWGQNICDTLEVSCLRLAGRESRLEEPFAKDINNVVEEIIHALLPIIRDKPFAFFGHSLGSYIAFMTSLHLKEKYKLEPMHLFVSSMTTPYSKAWPKIPKLNELTEEEINSLLIEFGGTPMSFFDDEQLLQESIPKLLADIQLMSSHSFDKLSKAVLACDLTCFVGSEDVVKDVEAWKDMTNGTVDIHVLPGNHFYLLEPDNENFIKNYITKCLELSMLADF
ncbi:S-acyl fatty acid synthase thioesterase, medium chain [Marmota flaviventris]|uniref:S-acyl fatty acid synthase thioesterase, medium chain n=1 Tax=Marmota flaviventris TaxID=93162 RepID=UPI003A84844C